MKRTYLKFCSFALAMVMVLAAFAGTFTFTATAAAIDYDSLVYDEWDGSYDLTWDSAGENAYYINSAEELAGIAKATYQKVVEQDASVVDQTAFIGVTFYITVNIDLKDIEWIPIGSIQNAKNVTGPFSDITTTATVNRFGGNLIGMLGKEENATITIRGFKMANTFAVNGNAGLIGNHYGGDVKNITMYKPEIESTHNTMGFFVGYARGFDSAPYKGTEQDYHVYENLTVIEGDLNAVNNNYVGGIVAYSTTKATYTNCAVIDSTIIGGAQHVGGIAGNSAGKGTSFTNCYVNGLVKGAKRVAGISGIVSSNATLPASLTDCHVDAIIDGSGTQCGAFIGRFEVSTEGTLNLTRCVNTGVSTKVRDTSYLKDGFTWIGLVGGYNGTFNLNLVDCYDIANIGFAARIDASISSSNLPSTYKIKVNNGAVNTLGGGTYDNCSYTGNANLLAAFKPTLLTTANADSALTVLNTNNLWVKRNGEATPMLKIAQDEAERPYANADLSWFDPMNYKDGFTITTNEQYLGLAMLSQLSKYSKTEYTYAIAKTVDTAAYADKFAAGFLTAIEPFVANEFADEGDLTLKLQVAADATLDAETKLRLVSALDAADLSKYTEVGFVLYNGTKAVKLSTTTAYKTINGTENGMPVEFNATVFDKTADDYLFTAVIDQIPTEAFATKLDIRVYAIEEDGTVVYGETYYDVTVQALIEALTPAE